MTSVMAVDGVTLFLCSKDLTVKLLAECLQCNGRKFEEAKDLKCVFVFVHCLFELKYVSSHACFVEL